MINFDALDGKTSTVVTQEAKAAVVERVKITPLPEEPQRAAHLLQESWDWQGLRDYVFREIERRHGPQPRNGKTEASIFKSFLSRWEDDAVRIAKAAFEIYDGMWANAPISVNRFCKNSDPFFAAQIIARLER
jgi:hypothetical protein